MLDALLLQPSFFRRLGPAQLMPLAHPEARLHKESISGVQTFSIKIKSSSSSVPFAPPIFSLINYSSQKQVLYTRIMLTISINSTDVTEPAEIRFHRMRIL